MGNLVSDSERKALGIRTPLSVPTIFNVPDVVRAKYKLEIQFGPDRKSNQPSAGIMTLWASGRRFHGGGDETVFFCGFPDCGKGIIGEYVSPPIALCPHCRRALFTSAEVKALAKKHPVKFDRTPDEVREMAVISDTKLFKLTATKLSHWMAQVWRVVLDGDADVYLKFHPLDIRYDPKHDDKRSPDILERARAAREPAIYPLHRILHDTNAGQELWKCFHAFITA